MDIDNRPTNKRERQHMELNNWQADTYSGVMHSSRSSRCTQHALKIFEIRIFQQKKN